MRVRVKSILPAPPDVVFDFVADMHNDPQWAPMVTGVEQTTGDGPGLGAEYVIQQKIGGRVLEIPMKVVEHERPRRLRWVMDHRALAYDSIMEFAPHPKGTVATQTTTETWHRAPFWLKLVAPSLVRRQLRRQFALLARAVSK